MTIENTLENKKRFFALYWMQNVYMGNVKSSDTNILNETMLSWTSEQTALLLKPLSSITDEEAFTVADLANCKFRAIYRDDCRVGVYQKKTKSRGFEGEFINIDFLRAVVELDDNIPYEGSCFGLDVSVYDYLRSCSYALPFMGVPVGTLVEWGWVNLEKK